MKKILSLMLLISLLSGCSLVGQRSAHVSLADLKFQDITLFETTALCTVRIENDGDKTLSLDGANYRFEINGTRIGTGSSSESISIPAFGSATQTVKVYLSNFKFLTNLQDWVESKDFTYRIDGSLKVADSFGFNTIPIEVEERFKGLGGLDDNSSSNRSRRY